VLNRRGVDAYLGATQLRKLERPQGYKYKTPEQMKKFFDKVIKMMHYYL
jgi:hypothetical protein